MAAYVIVDVNIIDPTGYEEYKKLAGPTVGRYGGRYVVRGGDTEVLEGSRQPGRVVVLEFPTREQAKAWWSSPEYAPAKKLRQAAATTEMLVAEGL
jgi:uncharacterized protein (DUF1330 family)